MGVGTALLVAKFMAWKITASQVVFSDAAESIVNVAASTAALTAVWVSSMPADENHPYGHGKVEFITGGFEGGMIAFAAIVIVYGSVIALIDGTRPHELGIGMAVVGGAGVGNLLLGRYLVRTGRTHKSPALVADGKHVLSDVWTSAGAILGLAAVHFTGVWWLDPLVAILFALVLLRTGAALVREAARGLMDEFDPTVVDEVARAMERARVPGIIEIHDFKAIDVGGHHHVDCHVVVPEFWSVERAHGVMDAFEAQVMAASVRGGEVQFHVDPCERAYCRGCDLTDCDVRIEPFVERRRISPDAVTRGPAPGTSDSVHDDR